MRNADPYVVDTGFAAFGLDTRDPNADLVGWLNALPERIPTGPVPVVGSRAFVTFETLSGGPPFDVHAPRIDGSDFDTPARVGPNDAVLVDGTARSVTPDAAWVVMRGPNGIYRAAVGTQAHDLVVELDRGTIVSYSGFAADGRRFAVSYGTRTSTVVIVDVQSGQEVQRATLVGSGNLQLEWANDGALIVLSDGRDNLARAERFDLDRREQTVLFEVPSTVQHPSRLTPDRNRIVFRTQTDGYDQLGIVGVDDSEVEFMTERDDAEDRLVGFTE